MKTQIPAQAKTPLVEKDLELNIIKIVGVLIPGKSMLFFEELYSFLLKNFLQKTKKLNYTCWFTNIFKHKFS